MVKTVTAGIAQTMVDVVLPPGSSVILEPAETLGFHLQRDAEPQATLTIHNVSDMGPIAFKVKTKRPDSYLVRPHQGLLEPNGSTCITLVLLQKECSKLVQCGSKERQLVNDKFLVQSVEVDHSFYARAKRRTPKEMMDGLRGMWTQVDRQSVSSRELLCRFYWDAEDEVHQLKQDLRRLRDDPTDTEDDNEFLKSDTTWATSTRSSTTLLQNQNTPRLAKSYNGDTPTVVALRRRYDELMVLAEQLTGRRDALASDLATTQQQLQRVSIDAQRVREALGGAKDSMSLESGRW
ncbi:hypothetical protein PHYPSEUDO_005913 [Phytophthora pseudosyringae]|uniref:MSP domain-containing protein n=1 Tax=Phytophthora pseudosyringae TaxID=221518 RepID=A0A8T1VNC5_9STRA|nr:hypothetical protein PHYPSEUDO_005913 [Phytophthora pseudosyringae]